MITAGTTTVNYATIASLRQQAFKRSEGFCEGRHSLGRRSTRCMAPLTWWTFALGHIVPRGRGGSDTLDNVQCLCVPCQMKGK